MPRINRKEPPQTDLAQAARKAKAEQRRLDRAGATGAVETLSTVEAKLNNVEVDSHWVKSEPLWFRAVAHSPLGAQVFWFGDIPKIAYRIQAAALRLRIKIAQAKDPGAQSSSISKQELESLLKAYKHAKGIDKAMLGELCIRAQRYYDPKLLEPAANALAQVEKEYLALTLPGDEKETAKAFFDMSESLAEAQAHFGASTRFAEKFAGLSPELREKLRPILFSMAFDGTRPRFDSRTVEDVQTLYATLASPQTAQARLNDLLAHVEWSAQPSSSGGSALDTKEVNRILDGLERITDEGERAGTQAALRKALFDGERLNREITHLEDLARLRGAVLGPDYVVRPLSDALAEIDAVLKFSGRASSGSSGVASALRRSDVARLIGALNLVKAPNDLAVARSELRKLLFTGDEMKRESFYDEDNDRLRAAALDPATLAASRTPLGTAQVDCFIDSLKEIPEEGQRAVAQAQLRSALFDGVRLNRKITNLDDLARLRGAMMGPDHVVSPLSDALAEVDSVLKYAQRASNLLKPDDVRRILEALHRVKDPGDLAVVRSEVQKLLISGDMRVFSDQDLPRFRAAVFGEG
jgi:hypothetical protein